MDGELRRASTRRIGPGNNATSSWPTRAGLGCSSLRQAQDRPGLSACGGGDFVRRPALPEAIKHWPLTSIQTRLINTGGRLVRHAEKLVFQLAEVFIGMGERIGGLRLAPG